MQTLDDITIRPLERADVARIPAYFDGLSPATRATYHPFEFNQQDVTRIAAQLGDDRSAHVGAFCGDGGEERMVGHVWYTHKGGYGRPGLGIGIVDEFQGSGVGQALMAEIDTVASARGEKQIELSVYLDNHRAMRVYAKTGYRIIGRTGDNRQARMVRDFGDDDSPFAIRGMYAHGIPWNIAGLTIDTWTLDDWKWYIELLNAAGCNFLKIYMWSVYYYHPDEPELARNAWRYDVLHDALAYARTLGMTTNVGFSSGTVPHATWLRYPKLRADDIWYTGITLCWRRGRDRLLPYQEYLFDRFADVADSFVVWFVDPGACRCDLCRDYLPVMLDAFETLSDRLGDRAEMSMSPWALKMIEEGGGGFAPHPNLSRNLSAAVPDGTRVLIHSERHDTIRIMSDAGLVPLPMAFFLDPEGGYESSNVLPEPKLGIIDDWLDKSQQEGQSSALAYRLTSYTQYPSDYYYFRRQLNPGASRETLLTELGELVCNPRRQAEFEDAPRRFAAALDRLECWWGSRDDADLRGAADELNMVAGQVAGDDIDSPVRHLADAAALLQRLADGPGDLSLDEFAEELRAELSLMPIFRGLTLEYLWDERARTYLGLRVGPWLKRLER